MVEKNTSSLVSMSSARGHHICDNHASRLHLSSEMKHPCVDPYYLQPQQEESFKPSECLGEWFHWQFCLSGHVGICQVIAWLEPHLRVFSNPLGTVSVLLISCPSSFLSYLLPFLLSCLLIPGCWHTSPG